MEPDECSVFYPSCLHLMTIFNACRPFNNHFMFDLTVCLTAVIISILLLPSTAVQSTDAEVRKLMERDSQSDEQSMME